MGEEADAAVQNATAPGGESPAPGEMEAAPSEDGGQESASTEVTSLTGDETEEQIREHLKKEFAGTGLSENRIDQLLRWRMGQQEGKAAKAELERLKAESEEVGDVSGAFEEMYRQYGAMYEHLGGSRDKGAADFVKFLTDPEYGKPQAIDGLSSDDPRDKVIMELKNQVDQMVARQQEAVARADEEASITYYKEQMDGAVDKLPKMPDAQREIVEMLADGMAQQELPNIDDLRALDYVTIAKKAHAMVTGAFGGQAGGQEQTQPKPVVSEEPSSTGVSYENETTEDREAAEAIRNATT